MKYAPDHPTLDVDLEDRRDKPHAARMVDPSNHQQPSPIGAFGLNENERKSLIAAIVSFIRLKDVPPRVREAALTLVEWLARRDVSEFPCQCGVVEARRQSMIPPPMIPSSDGH